MKVEILQCSKCKDYTLEKECSECNQKTITPKPARFSIEDKYGKYRRMAKNELEHR
ncbi:RNA-protein complex protein Nop10 [Candidatus Woesearchaeota archaeon]|jgi:H/ACA ribonucleoprotein complex subunit 3|nr:RNA-protein complex protein Nop10 [Candidatus Woesearchaeota archaeon]MBT5215263.1 RNA-protein complex protein Nop10 [Candidatus Woesearchaeota archaeon]MBT6402200.1 RNA-protein complex protein Nop10 [Candidatus Woesearchaeota archaeon]